MITMLTPNSLPTVPKHSTQQQMSLNSYVYADCAVPHVQKPDYSFLQTSRTILQDYQCVEEK